MTSMIVIGAGMAGSCRNSLSAGLADGTSL